MHQGDRFCVDDSDMDTTDPIYRETCFRCERPALTFDAQHRPLCGRHATIFIAAPRLTSKNDELVALSSADDYPQLRVIHHPSNSQTHP